ncbi:MAG: DUF4143 domain-containing protein, partial [Acidobacteriota bacterium]
RLAARGRDAVLVLDEIQKIPRWSESVKQLWDEDTASDLPLRVVLLGSSPLLMEAGLGESLAGRFETIRMTHWSFPEMRAAFGWDLDRYLLFGGYPGSASLVDDPDRWRSYLFDALIEPVISRDILLRTRVDKPALLRRLFQLGCDYSSQVLSFQKMVGQLVDAGNTTTLAHYLELLEGAGVLAGLQKFSIKPLVRRTSSPKLLALNTGLMTASQDLPPGDIRRDPALWGRFVETAIGAHLYNRSLGSAIELLYWRHGSHEVDFVLRRGPHIAAIEVKSGARRENAPGLSAFEKTAGPTRKILVGTGGIPLEEFFETPVESWLRPLAGG